MVIVNRASAEAAEREQQDIKKYDQAQISPIVNLLQSSKHDARISIGNRWMVWAYDEWVVYGHKYHAKQSQVLYKGDNEAAAVLALVTE